MYVAEITRDQKHREMTSIPGEIERRQHMKQNEHQKAISKYVTVQFDRSLLSGYVDGLNSECPVAARAE